MLRGLSIGRLGPQINGGATVVVRSSMHVIEMPASQRRLTKSTTMSCADCHKPATLGKGTEPCPFQL